MDFGSLALMGNLLIWLTPVWLLAAGVTIGLAVLLVLYGLLWIVGRKAAAQVPAVVREGILQPIFYLAAFLAIFTFVAAPQMPVREFVRAATQIGAVGPKTVEVTVPPRTEFVPVPVSFRAAELRSYEITSDQDVDLYAKKDLEAGLLAIIQAGEPTKWEEGKILPSQFRDDVDGLFVTNDGGAPAHLKFHFVTNVQYPEVWSAPIAAGGMIGLFLFYFFIRFAFPKVAAIAATTSRQAFDQPVFLLAMILGAVSLVIFIYIPGNTFGEDVKMLKDAGLTLIMVLAILVALWTSSVSVAEEIEGKTALTLLSKPIGRRQFIFGKFLGIIWPAALLFILLGFLFLVTVSYKVVYDARETANPEPDWQKCYVEMISVVPGLVLAFLETVVLASISVAISTRLPMLANLLICGSIYVLGHLVPMIVNSSAGQFEAVRFMGMLIATIFPVLDHFNIQAAVAAGAVVPTAYLGLALLYCALYSTIMMLAALALFEDRDLA